MCQGHPKGRKGQRPSLDIQLPVCSRTAHRPAPGACLARGAGREKQIRLKLVCLSFTSSFLPGWRDGTWLHFLPEMSNVFNSEISADGMAGLFLVTPGKCLVNRESSNVCGPPAALPWPERV